MTAELPSQDGWGRLPVHARFRRPPAASAGPRQLCRHRPANADGTSRSSHESPKQASKSNGEDLQSSRRLGSLKSQIPPKLESKPKLLVEDESKRGSLKRESKPEVRVEARSTRRSRKLLGILDIDATVDCKCQEHNSNSKQISS